MVGKKDDIMLQYQDTQYKGGRDNFAWNFVGIYNIFHNHNGPLILLCIHSQQIVCYNVTNNLHKNINS